jgi:serine/threonine protein kinase
MHWYGTHGPYNVMVIQLLGHSLQDMFRITGGKTFSIRCVLLLAEQALTRLEILHQCGILHRDIKPANFVMGRGRLIETLYLIDFGLSKFYLDAEGHHIPYRTEKELTGTARYASLNTHLGREQSRRDDLESLGFVLVYFVKGFLPWQGARPHETKEDLYLRISNHKEALPINALCEGLPACFAEFLTYCRYVSRMNGWVDACVRVCVRALGRWVGGYVGECNDVFTGSSGSRRHLTTPICVVKEIDLHPNTDPMSVDRAVYQMLRT